MHLYIDDIYTLPYYKLNKSDIFEWKYEWESRKIYKYISLREPQKRIPIYPISETIKNIFLSSMGWPIFKAQAILKNDYLKFREALASIPKESILERVADTYGRIMSALLKSYDMLPPVRVSSAGDLVDIKIGYRLPPSEEDFFKLYSWPVRYDFPIRSPQIFTRRMAKEVYPVFRHVLESIGYCFAEE